MIAATCIPLVLNILWSPLIDSITNDKYGAVNKTNFLLLTLCLPFQYMNNLLWTVEFAQNRLKRIFKITAVTCIIIIAGDLLMIPLLNARGAAIVYLLATITEYLIYLRVSIIGRIQESWRALLFCTGIMLLSDLTVTSITDSVLIKLLFSATIYLILLYITGQIKKDDLQIMREWLCKKQTAYVYN